MSNRQPDSYDFRDLQEALQQFLSTHPDFKDVNWKGSVAARMVDLHAYNTSINASSVGFAFNESSINSATIRSNVAAKASGILNFIILFIKFNITQRSKSNDYINRQPKTSFQNIGRSL